MDTGRAIVKTAQLAIILHAACNAWGNAIITFFTPSTPPHVKSRSEHQTLFPLFGEGSGHETRYGVLNDLVKWGGVAPRSESSNQIAERVIIGDDVAIEHEI